MNDKKNISIYLPVSFLLEIDNFIKDNNISSRGDFVCAAARYYMDNSNRTLIEKNNDSNIKSMEELPIVSVDDLYHLLNQSIIDDKSAKNNLSNLVEQVVKQLKEFNDKSSKILATLIDDKSSKTVPEENNKKSSNKGIDWEKERFV